MALERADDNFEMPFVLPLCHSFFLRWSYGTSVLQRFRGDNLAAQEHLSSIRLDNAVSQWRRALCGTCLLFMNLQEEQAAKQDVPNIIGSLFLEMILQKTLPFLEMKLENLKNLVIGVGLLSKRKISPTL